MKPGLSPRITACKFLGRVLQQGQSLDDVFVAEENLSPQDTAFVRAMVMTTLRHLGQIDQTLTPLSKRAIHKIKPPHLLNILRLGTAQLLCMDSSAAHAAVDLSVDMAAKNRKTAYAKGMVNAILRRIGRENITLAGTAEDNIPEWLWQTWCKDYDEETAQQIAGGSLKEALLDITVKNPDEREKWAEALEAEILPTGTLRCKKATGRIYELPGFGEGAWWVQDASSAIPVQLLAQDVDLSGQHVLDLCAAPGGKTLQLAALGAKVTAVDKSAKRLRRLHENLERTGLSQNVTVVEADVTSWQPEEKADYVLLDAPCSATGTIRRHPDLLHLKSSESIKSLSDIQQRAFENASKMLKDGGRMVYCVCSIDKREGAGHAVPKGLDTDPIKDFPLEIDEKGNVTILPYMQDGMDGFYIARFRR